MPPDMETNEAEVSVVMSESENEYDEIDTHSKDGDETMADSNIAESVDANGDIKKKYDPKDPMRPRRKKARRACFACQRAHLTCGMPRLSLCSPSTRVAVNSTCIVYPRFLQPSTHALALPATDLDESANIYTNICSRG